MDKYYIYMYNTCSYMYNLIIHIIIYFWLVDIPEKNY